MRKRMKKFLYLVSVLLMISSSIIGQTAYNATNGKKTITTCEGTFYDSGGSVDGYSVNETDTVVFYPTTENGKVTLTFSSFSLETEVDWMYIYDGPSTESTLINEYTGTTSPGTITATNADGALTVVFFSDGSETMAGWVASLSCSGGEPTVTVSTFKSSVSGTTGLVFDDANNMYVARGTYITKITPEGVESQYATGLSTAQLLAFDKNGNLYCTSDANSRVYKITSEGTVTTFATVDYPFGIVYSRTQDVLYVCGYYSHAISKITMDGTISTFVTISSASRSMGLTMDKDSNLYTTDFMGGSVYKISKAGIVSTFSTATYGYTSIEYLKSGNFLCSDYNNNKIMLHSPSGVVSTYSGTGTAATVDGGIATAQFNQPYYSAIDKEGNYYVVGYSNKDIRKISNIDTTSAYKKITSIDITNTQATITSDKGTLQINVSIIPSDATDDRTISYFVSDNTKASINSSGLLTAINNGTIKVYAKLSMNPKIYDSLSVTLSNQSGPDVTMNSPNGGQTYNAGDTIFTNVTVTSNFSDYLYYYLSTDSGKTWSNFEYAYYHYVNYSGGTLKAQIIIPKTTVSSTNCLLKLEGYYYPALYSDITNKVFTIKGLPPTLEITSPKPASFVSCSTSYSIGWSTFNVSGNVKLFYSLNNGETWNFIVNASNTNNYDYNSYSWYVPATISGHYTSCKIGIASTDSSVVGESEAFTISSTEHPCVFTYPASNDTLAPGTYYYIKYNNRSSSSLSYNYLYYSLNNGVSWTSVTYYYPEPGNNQIQWYAPNIDSVASKCILRLGNNVPYAYSESFVIAPQPSITFIDPSYDYWVWNTLNHISFTTKLVDKVKIEYSSDGGSAWTTIVDDYTVINGENNYDWTTPTGTGYNYNYQIRITDKARPSVTTTTYFYMRDKAIDLTYPNDGVSVAVGDTLPITYTTNQNLSYFYFQISYDGGLTWNSVDGSMNSYYSGTYTFNYVIPYSTKTASNCKVKAYYYSTNYQNDPIYSDISEGAFTITEAKPKIWLTRPIAEDYWQSGTVKAISWYSYSVSSVNISYSIDGGATWNSVASDVASLNYSSSNTYNWTIPSSIVGLYDSCYIKIQNAAGTVIGTSPFFTISDQSALFVSKPKKGNVWTAASTYTIEYGNRSNDYVYSQYLFVSYDGGSKWNQIVYLGSIGKQTSTYSWTVPIDAKGTSCRVALSDYSMTNYAISDEFTIQPAPPSLKYLNYPASNVYLKSGTSTTIQWNTLNVDTVDIWYSIDGGSKWLSIQKDYTPKNNSYSEISWNIPVITGETSTNCLVKVSSKKDPTNVYVLSGIFAISNKDQIEIINPVATTVAKASEQLVISYKNNGRSISSYMYVYYSLNGGSSWNYITSFYGMPTGEGSSSWTIDKYIATNANVQIAVSQDNPNYTTVKGVSKSFTVQGLPAKINVYTPASGDYLVSNSQRNIYWSSINASSYVKVEYKTNGMANWGTINNSVYNSNSEQNYLSFTVPSVSGTKDSCSIRVVDANNVGDTTELFTISNQSQIQIVKPVDSDTLQAGGTYNIVLNNIATQVETIYLYYLNPSNSLYSIATLYNTGTGIKTYNWSIPSGLAGSNDYRIVARDYDHNTYDTSEYVTVKAANPSIKVSSPSIGSVLWSGDGAYVYYSSVGVSNVDISYSIDGGINWTNVVTNQATSNYYYMTMPVVSGTKENCYVKIASNFDNKVFGISPVFTIKNEPTQYTVIKPNGGEIYTAGNYVDIEFVNNGKQSTAYIYYSLNGGEWNYITSKTAYYGKNNSSWYIPIITKDSKAKIKVQDNSQSTILDTSDLDFTIVAAKPYITINTPASSAWWVSDRNYSISFNSLNVEEAVLEYSVDAGATWVIIDTIDVVDGKNSINALAPKVEQLSRYAQIRLTMESNSQVYGTSSIFNLSKVPPILHLLTPDGGESYTAGNSISIIVNNEGQGAYADIQMSVDSGYSWSNISTGSYFGSGKSTYSYFIDYYTETTTDVLVRIVPNDSYNNTGDISSSVFTINEVEPYINVYSPGAASSFWTSENTYIRWNSVHVDNVSISLSTDNKKTWSIVETNVVSENGANSFYWSVPEVEGKKDSCFIKVVSTANSELVGVSNRFTIDNSPSVITVIKPNGGENYTAGKTISISYKYTGRPRGYVDIYISTDGGKNVNYIGRDNEISSGINYYYYDIPAESKTSSNCIVYAIEGLANNPAKDSSDSKFSITAIPPSITVSSPQSMAYLVSDEVNTVAWNCFKVSKVKIEYSTNGGGTWSEIVNNIVSVNGYNSYNFVTPAVEGTFNNSIIKVSSAYNSTISGSSKAFTLTNVPIGYTVLWPNGGETLQAGKTSALSFSRTGPKTYEYLTISLSTDGGETYSYIGSTYVNTVGKISYNWNVDKFLSGKYCKIKVSNSDGRLVDESDEVFEILPAPASIEVTSPTAYSNWLTGSNQTIYWNSVSVDKVTLQYSLDAGASWKNFVSGVNSFNGNNSYNVVAPTVSKPEYNAKVRVYAENDTDAITATFTISTAPPTLTVLSPNGGETFKTGTTCFVKYDYTGPDATVNVLISSDGGNSWTVLGENTITSGTNSFEWEIAHDQEISNYYKVKVVTSTGSVFDLSNKYFAVVSGKPVLDITSPNSGSYYVVGSTAYINWNSRNIENVTFEYSLDGGVTWNLIENNVGSESGNNNYAWDVPSVDGTNMNAVVKVTSATDNKVFDLSENFIISDQQRSITVISPNGGETLNAGKYYNVEFSNNGPKTTVRIDLVSDGQDNVFLASYDKTQNGNNKVEVLIPEIAYGNKSSRILIMDNYNDNVKDESDAVFTVVGVSPYIQVITPEKENVWTVGDVKRINWESYNIDSVDIEYSIDGGTKWNTIAVKVPVVNGENYYDWTVIDVKADMKDALIRVKSSLTSTVNDLSEQFKLAGTPISITILSPNGGETVKAGSEYSVKYNYTGDETMVNVYISHDSGATFVLINSNLSKYGESEVHGNVPYDETLSDLCLIKVEDAAGISDTSDAVFSVVAADPTLNVQNPTAGSYWVSKTTQSISWFSWGVAKVKLEYSVDGGANFTQIRDRIPSWNGDNKFNWTVLTVSGDKDAVIRITESSTSATKATGSSSIFTITDIPIGFAITAPAKAGKMQAGKTDTVRFSYAGPWSYTNIYLSVDSGQTWTKLKDYVSIAKGSNKVAIEIPIETPASKYALIRIEDSNNSTISKISELFEITAASPTLMVTNPVEKAFWVSGTIQSITWKSYSVEKVKLEYSLNGTSWNQIKTNIPAKDGDNQFNWKVVTVTALTKTAYVRITSVADASVSSQSKVFSMSDKYPSNDAKLSALNVAGTLISGFDARVMEYNYSIAFTAQKPVVTATASDTKASVNIVHSNNMPGFTTITVLAEDGITTMVYTISYNRLPAGTVSTLSDLKVSGTTVSGFSSTKYIYNIELAGGTTKVPVVTATATDKNASVAITNASKLPGKTTVVVTAEDGSKKTYEINFSVKVSVSELANVNIELYPNPVLNKLHIENAMNSDIHIYNFNGQLISTMKAIESLTEIDMSLYYPGIYFVKIVKGNDIVTKKVEKIK